MIYFRDYLERFTLTVCRARAAEPPFWWFEGYPAAGPVALLTKLRRLTRDPSIVEARIDRLRVQSATGVMTAERVMTWRRGDKLPTGAAWRELLLAQA